MNSNTAVIVLLVLIIGFGIGYLGRGSQMPAMGTHMMSDRSMMGDSSMGMGSAMQNMMGSISGKSGDEFDEAFLAMMIVHHEGAVAMAEAALESAKHEEIKEMARAIISAQNAEIEQMKAWQKSWYAR